MVVSKTERKSGGGKEMACIEFKNYMHIGVVVYNIEDTLARMRRVFSLDGYRINPFPPEGEQVQLMYHGKKTFFSARFCFLQMGDTELELIEPVEGESVWKDFLRENGEGIHHIKVEVESINETIRQFRKIGVPCIQYGSAVGPNAGKTWAYFDTREQLGYITEILNRQIGECVEEE